MRIAESASVYLITTQTINRSELARFLDDHATGMPTAEKPATEPDLIPEIAGRVCYMSFGRKAGRKENDAYLQHILESGHGSVLEHTVFGLLFTNVSRALTHELVRHRAGWSYSQLSQRYVDSSDAAMVLPPALLRCPEPLRTELIAMTVAHHKQSLAVCETLVDKLVEVYADPVALFEFAVREGVFAPALYSGLTQYAYSGAEDGQSVVRTREAWIGAIAGDEKLRSDLQKATSTARRKAAREAARCVLPNATETKIFVTANARALRHFLELRGSVAADQEIRALAVQILKLVKGAAPNIFSDMVVGDLPDGSQDIRCTYRKV